MSAPGALQPEELDTSAVRSLLGELLPQALPGWLESRRWFADKGRDISGVTVEDALVERVGVDWLVLAVSRVTFVDDSATRYFLPLALTGSPAAPEPVARVASGGVPGVVVDATETPWFGGWLLDQFAGRSDQAHEAWTFAANPAARTDLAAARGSSPIPMRAEQSNSSLRFDDVLIVKLFRRLQPGLNPDEEILRALAEVRFEQVPRFVGSVAWRSGDGMTHAVALVQRFVPNIGDGWAWILQRLAGVAAGTIDPAADRFAAERSLGRRTGELHVALGAVREPAFEPETADGPVIAADARRTRAAIAETIRLLQERQHHVPDELKNRLPDAILGLRPLVERVEGYQAELNTWRIRVHGDYHLGQTLRTPDGDWVIIDFEGEPARTLEERRRPTSVLKDVAGMLRSFGYARGATERAADLPLERAARDRLETWELGARGAFLEGYRQALLGTSMRFVPEDDEAFALALAAWELDKALYEVAYEARNRPGWIGLPLRSLVPDLIDQAAEAAGGAPA